MKMGNSGVQLRESGSLPGLFKDGIKNIALLTVHL